MVFWTEVDSATTDAVETDIVFGPATTATSFQGQVLAGLDNLPTQHPHYSLVPTYCNMAVDELLTLGLALGKEMLDQMPRLRNWRWWGKTTAGIVYMPLPERMLYLEEFQYTKDLNSYDPSTSVLYPSTEITAGEDEIFGILSRTSTGYPSLYRRAGSRIEIWPVPQSSPSDYRSTVVVSGTRMDNILTNPTDTLLMAPRLQLLAIDLSVVISMEKMGWEEAAERRGALETKLARLVSPGKKERVKKTGRTQVAGTPR